MSTACNTGRSIDQAAISFYELDRLCGGRPGKTDVPCPLCGPDRKHNANRNRKTLRIWRKDDGFISYVCARCDAKGYAHEPRATKLSLRKTTDEADDRERVERIKRAQALWAQTVPLAGTLGHKYLTEIRGLKIDNLNLEHVLRWHERHRMMIALMTDPLTKEPRGIHRTFLDAEGNKLERKMLGPQGVIRLSPDEQVTQGLGICEGIEDGLAILLSGWAPIWAATCAGAIQRFPLLAGIEALTIFQDDDHAGRAAAIKCAKTWDKARREVFLVEADNG